MNVHGARDGAHRSGANAVLACRLERTRTKTRMRGQAEIVVRREVDDAAVVEGGLRLLLVFENAKAAVQPLFFKGIQFRREVRERIAPHTVLAVREKALRE